MKICPCTRCGEPTDSPVNICPACVGVHTAAECAAQGVSFGLTDPATIHAVDTLIASGRRTTNRDAA